jgi:SAM-dependent methyltransferase
MLSKNTSILEIGAGRNPAILIPGFDLSQQGVRFDAVDLNPDVVATAQRDQFELYAKFGGTLLQGNCAKIEVDSGTYSHILMKNVFGEYTHPSDRRVSNIEEVYKGIPEASRLLRPGGEIVIAEENTPLNPTGIAQALLGNGFEDVSLYPCQGMQNPHWAAKRTAYWGIANDGNGKPLDAKHGYLIHATRPESDSTPAVTENLTVKQQRTLAYQRRRLSHVKIVARDETVDLETYQDRIVNGSPTEIYFKS